MPANHRLNALVLLGLGLPILVLLAYAPARAEEQGADRQWRLCNPKADQALALLREGNARFATEAMLNPDEDMNRRRTLAASGQHPFVSILCCADSRVPPEELFDQGLGTLFVARVAGNVAEPGEIATLEYGADHLGIPLIVVLGHTQCGAVTAVVTGEPAHGLLPELVKPIDRVFRAVSKANPGATQAELIDKTIEANIWDAIAELFTLSEVLREKARDGALCIIGALCHIDSGKVDFLGPHPDEAALLRTQTDG